MRELKTKDVFNAMRLASEINLKEVLAKTRLQTDESTLGYELIMTVMSSLSTDKAEHLFYVFISELLEMSADEVKEMDALAFIEAMKELSTVIHSDDWIRFFQSVLQLI